MGGQKKYSGYKAYSYLEPEKDYEFQGFRPGTVFPCSVVILKDRLFVYYGAGDQFVAVASCNLDTLLGELKKYRV